MNKILFLIGFLSCISCKTQIQDQNILDIKDSITSSILEKTNKANVDLTNIYGKWEKEKSFKSGIWIDNVEYYYNKYQTDTLNDDIGLIISEKNIVVSGKCKSNFNLNKDVLSGYDYNNKNSEEVLLSEFGIDLNDSLFFIETVECEKPFDKIYILPNKLLIREYGAYYTVFKKSTNFKKFCISSATNIKLPFTSNDLKKYTKPFELTDCVEGDIDNFYCGEDKLRYISLLNKDSLNVILVPMDCGDFSLYQLLVLRNNRLVSNIQVDGKWYEIDNEDNYTLTTFSLQDDLKFTITIDQYQKNKLALSNIQDYIINTNGLIFKK